MNRIKLGIRQRVLIITVLPLLMITIILGGYFINTQLDDAHSTMVEKGQTLSRLMASTAEFGLITGNKDILSSLIRSATKPIEVTDVAFLDANFNTIIRGNPSEPPLDKNEAYPYFTNGLAYFLHPVVATGFDVIDNPEYSGEQPDPEFLGWVAIVLSEKPTKARQKEILFRGLLLASLGLLVTILIASRFGRKITNPILGLTHVVEMLQSGQLETRASLSSTGELHSLAQGINKLAHKVKESNLDLEERVDKATQRLRSTLVHLEKQNQALDVSRKRADRANSAKDEFLARMSHELRTPLTSVSGFARLLEQTDLKLEQKEYTRIINLTSGLLLSIIDDILDYSKLESNAIELEAIPFDLQRSVLDVLEMQTAAAHQKSLELIPLIQPDIPRYIIGDPVRMRQILTNLIGNSIKFTEDGYIAVHITSHNISNISSNIKITIEDTGSGIANERLSNLFKAFSQADTSITRKHGGSGLGLVIAKRLTELMSGRIALNSQIGSGTKVTLEIPFTTSPQKRHGHRKPIDHLYIYDPSPLIREGLRLQLVNSVTEITEIKTLKEIPTIQDENSKLVFGFPAGELSEEHISQLKLTLSLFKGRVVLPTSQPLPAFLSPRVVQLRKPPRTQLLLNALSPDTYLLPEGDKTQKTGLSRKTKVLVAEDNDFNRLLIRKILQQAGADTVEATTGEEAVSLAAKKQPDIILMDVHMPVMDGIEATRKIRLSDQTTPIIALTANVIASEHERLIESGVNTVLLKPINDNALCGALDKYLNNKAPTTTQNETTKQSTLEKYDISKETLKEELIKQLEGLESGFKTKDIQLMRNHSHQIQGLAGLYELPELEMAGISLNSALKEGEMKGIWKELWQLQRLIKNEQF